MDLVRSRPHCHCSRAAQEAGRGRGRRRAGAYGLPAAAWRLPGRERAGRGLRATACCRLAPAAACLAACALRPEPGACALRLPSAEGGLCRRPSRWRVAAGGWGLGRIRGCAWCGGGVLACGRGGVGVGRTGGWGEPAKGRGARSVETSSSMLGWASSNKLKKKILGRTPGHGPGGPGSKSAPACRSCLEKVDLGSEFLRFI